MDNITTDTSYSIKGYQAAIFIVVLVLEFVASLIGNVILIAMIHKNRKVQTTVNTFLAGFEISYLCEMLMMCTTVSTLARGGWMYGEFLCLLQKQILATVVIVTPVIHLFLSKEIRKMATMPCQYKTNLKRVVLHIVFSWIVVAVSLSIIEALYFDTEKSDNLNLCSPIIINNPDKEAIFLIYGVIVVITLSGILITTLYNYFKVLYDDPVQNRDSNNTCMLLVNNTGHDRERVKSILPIFLMQFICTMFACLWGSYTMMYNMISIITKESQPIYESVFICIAILPAVSPLILMYSSANYRSHINKHCPYCIKSLPVYLSSLQDWIPRTRRSNKIYQMSKSCNDAAELDDDIQEMAIDMEMETARYWHPGQPKIAWED
ncbi:pyroglutamylated RF-amide peptide receptor-like [Dysidea avara]|uniref:pyroglutamylated RF-amide peptide receptor-like n=1 Tax=Dysidea avara TaxID=196820 RepID=UPI003322DD2F